MRRLLLAAFAVYYLTKVLLFEEKISHFGPFASKSEWVFRQATHYQQPVTLFDRIRRWSPFNPYSVQEIEGEWLWSVDEGRLERWTCPKCLSIWISLAISLFILVFIERPRTPSEWIEKLVLLPTALAGVTTLLTGHSDGLQLWKTHDTETDN